MRALVFSLVSLAIVDLAAAPTASPARPLPMYRPALLGRGPSALINRIDVKDLIAKGQKNAAIMFTCSVTKTGEVVWSGTYRGTPDSKMLEEELQKRLADAKFVPAVYEHVAVDAIYYGTVTFAVVDGKPRLRIFSNQETKELEKETDFIGPQPFFGGPSKFTGFHYPSKEEAPLEVKGAVELEWQVDAAGNLAGAKVLNEEPPLLGFGEGAIEDIQVARFIPAFRDGQPVPCTVTVPVYYTPKN